MENHSTSSPEWLLEQPESKHGPAAPCAQIQQAPPAATINLAAAPSHWTTQPRTPALPTPTSARRQTLLSAWIDAHRRYRTLDPSLPAASFSAFCRAMRLLRTNNDDGQIKRLFIHSRRITCKGNNDDLKPDAKWAWRIHSEPRIKDGRLIVEVRYRLQVLKGLNKFPADLTGRLYRLFRGETVIFADLLGTFGCVHVPKNRNLLMPPFRRELYTDFASFYETNTTRENSHIGICIWCNAEVFTNTRPAQHNERPTYHGGDRVFEVVGYIDLGQGLPGDTTIWDANTKEDMTPRLTDLWDLKRLFDADVTNVDAPYITDGAVHYELAWPYADFLRAVRNVDPHSSRSRCATPALKRDEPPAYKK